VLPLKNLPAAPWGRQDLLQEEGFMKTLASEDTVAGQDRVQFCSAKNAFSSPPAKDFKGVSGHRLLLSSLVFFPKE
jgi:hypothetical protein